MTIQLPSLIALFALLGCVILGAVVGWVLTGISTLLDFSLDRWWSYEVVPRLGPLLVLLGAAGGVWLWVMMLP